MFGQDETGGAATGSAAGSAAGSATGRKRSRSRQKKYATQALKAARDTELRQKRAAAKADLEERFLAHRARLEKRRKWHGPRKFGEWMRALAEHELEDTARFGGTRRQADQVADDLIALLQKRVASLGSQLVSSVPIATVDDYIEAKWQEKINAELARRPPREIE